MDYIWPSAEQWAYVQSQVAIEGVVTMLNLLKYRDAADYSDYPDETPCSGQEAYARYTHHAIPLVEAYGGKVLFSGPTLATVIGSTDKNWDLLVLAQYPSMKAFSDMASSEEYRGFAYHRAAGLEDSRLIPVRS